MYTKTMSGRRWPNDDYLVSAFYLIKLHKRNSSASVYGMYFCDDEQYLSIKSCVFEV